MLLSSTSEDQSYVNLLSFTTETTKIDLVRSETRFDILVHIHECFHRIFFLCGQMLFYCTILPYINATKICKIIL